MLMKRSVKIVQISLRQSEESPAPPSVAPPDDVSEADTRITNNTNSRKSVREIQLEQENARLQAEIEEMKESQPIALLEILPWCLPWRCKKSTGASKKILACRVREIARGLLRTYWSVRKRWGTVSVALFLVLINWIVLSLARLGPWHSSSCAKPIGYCFRGTETACRSQRTGLPNKGRSCVMQRAVDPWCCKNTSASRKRYWFAE